MQLDIKKIIESDVSHRLVKKAGRKFLREMYFTPATFFRQLTDHDSELLSEWASVIADVDLPDGEKYEEFQQMILITQILAIAEGVYLESEESTVNAIRAAAVMCVSNNLHRKGLVRCFYDNLTFGEDGLDLKIMEKLDD